MKADSLDQSLCTYGGEVFGRQSERCHILELQVAAYFEQNLVRARIHLVQSRVVSDEARGGAD